MDISPVVSGLPLMVSEKYKLEAGRPLFNPVLQSEPFSWANYLISVASASSFIKMEIMHISPFE